MNMEIKLKSNIQRAAALDNVARFPKRTEIGWSLAQEDQESRNIRKWNNDFGDHFNPS